MKKLVRLVVMLTIILLALSFGINRSEAGEAEMITFNLHRVVFSEHGISEVSQDGASENSGLNGVAFDVYDVTEDFYLLLERSEDKTVRDVQAELQGMKLEHRNSIDQQVTATSNEEEGIANFNLPRRSEGKDAVYLFRESDTPNNVEGKAADMVVALPVRDPLEEPIHLYPKYEISKKTLQVTNQKATTIGENPNEADRMTMETQKQQPVVGLLNILPKTNDLKNYLLMIIGGFLLIIISVVLAIHNRRRRNHHFFK